MKRKTLWVQNNCGNVIYLWQCLAYHFLTWAAFSPSVSSAFPHRARGHHGIARWRKNTIFFQNWIKWQDSTEQTFSVRTKLAAEQQHFHESTAGFSSLSENLRGGACHARWQWWGLDADITALQLYVPELDAVRRLKVDLRNATPGFISANRV